MRIGTSNLTVSANKLFWSWDLP